MKWLRKVRLRNHSKTNIWDYQQKRKVWKTSVLLWSNFCAKSRRKCKYWRAGKMTSLLAKTRVGLRSKSSTTWWGTAIRSCWISLTTTCLKTSPIRTTMMRSPTIRCKSLCTNLRTRTKGATGPILAMGLRKSSVNLLNWRKGLNPRLSYLL